jgi:hypothetical protein
MYIKVLGPGCVNCELVERRIWKVLSELKIPATVERVTEWGDQSRYRPMATPGLVIDERLVSAGWVPDRQELTWWILRPIMMMPFQ